MFVKILHALTQWVGITIALIAITAQAFEHLPRTPHRVKQFTFISMDRVFDALVLVAASHFVTPDQLQAVARRGMAKSCERIRRVERGIQAMFASLVLVAARRFVPLDQLQAVARRGQAEPEERIRRAHRGIRLPLVWAENGTHPHYNLRIS
jgi:hypothetical protein